MQEQTHNKNVCIILPVAQAHNIILTMSQINDFLPFSKKYALFGLHYSGIAEIFPGGEKMVGGWVQEPQWVQEQSPADDYTVKLMCNF